MRKHRAKSQVANVKASKARSLWSVVGGLSRRPVPGDVLECVRTHKKCIVWAVSKHGVHHVPYADKDPLYLHGTIMPWGLEFYSWVENVQKWKPANVPNQRTPEGGRETL